MSRVLITRAQPEADATAALVKELGYQPIVAPLTQTVTLEDGLDRVKQLGPEPGGVMVATSVRAVQALLDAQMRDFVAGQRWAVVGQRAGDLLTSVGAQLVIDPAPDVSGLIDTLPTDGPRTYLCAQDRKPDLETTVSFDAVVPVYAAQALDGFSRETKSDLHAHGVDCGLIYSVRGANLLFEALWYADLRYLLPITRWFCLSSDVSQAFRGRSQHSINCAVPKLPNQDALLDMLDQHLT